MKYVLSIFLLILVLPELTGQTLEGTKEGKISYVTTQNIYVKFQSTENIAAGDTLFSRQQGKMIPVLIVKEISSISVVCIPISSIKFSVSDQVFSRQKENQPGKTEVSIPDTALLPVVETKETTPYLAVQPKKEYPTNKRTHFNLLLFELFK